MNLNSKSTYSIVSKSPEDTIRIGQKLSAELKPGDVLGLTGDLGAGKTCLVKGIVMGLGGDDVVTSPTFVIMHRYQVDVPVNHLDLYRMETANLTEFGYEDFKDSGITVIEWAEKASNLELEDIILISFDILNQSERRLNIIFSKNFPDQRIFQIKQMFS